MRERPRRYNIINYRFTRSIGPYDSRTYAYSVIVQYIIAMVCDFGATKILEITTERTTKYVYLGPIHIHRRNRVIGEYTKREKRSRETSRNNNNNNNRL